jgi:hypothetical protein
MLERSLLQLLNRSLGVLQAASELVYLAAVRWCLKKLGKELW